MGTLSALFPLLHVPQAFLSAYIIYLSSITIPKLQRYEAMSEKAAQYSSTAEHQLQKTRTTQTSGALTVSHPISHIHPASPPVVDCVFGPTFSCILIADPGTKSTRTVFGRTPFSVQQSRFQLQISNSMSFRPCTRSSARPH